METLKKVLAVIGTILAAVGALFLFRKSKTPELVAELETKVEKNETLIKVEEAKREEIIADAEKEKAKDVTSAEVVDFFANRPK